MRMLNESCLCLMEVVHDWDGLHERDRKSIAEAEAVDAREKLVGECLTAETGLDEIVDEEMAGLSVNFTRYEVVGGL